MWSGVSRFVFGDPLPTEAEAQQRLTNVMALAVFASDALSSVAYATEEILLVLAIGGMAAMAFSLPVALAISTLLMIVASSYYQTVQGYPSGGGAFTVAHDNLGVWPGLIAAAALLIGYVLTVAVSITAGVAAITSAFPGILPFRVYIGLLAIAFIAWANLRGVRESGVLFAIPTYSFVAILFLLILVGLVRAITGNLPATVAQEAASAEGTLAHPSLFLILRAFASGCAALTGVEAISNGVPAFRKPEADNAGKTLVAMAVILAAMFLGITLLTRLLGIVPAGEETVISQIGRHVFGKGAAYWFLQVATALILVLAANTSFAGFPRLAAVLAQARYLPNQLTNLGDRLVYNNGIFALAILASALIVVFGGETHRLIPLYAVGVFLSFTLSQAGMVRHWYRGRGPGWRWKAGLNGLGAVTTGVVVLVIVMAKFLEGAWIVLLLIPAFVQMFRSIRRHYAAVAEQLSLEGLTPDPWEGLAPQGWHKVVVPIGGIHRGTVQALRFARTISTDVHAVIADVDSQVTARVKEKWRDWGHGVPLVVLESPYRSTVRPLMAYLQEVDERDSERGLAIVVLPEFVPARRWHHLLHNQTAFLLKTILVYRSGASDEDRVVINVPYHLAR
jgi:amino acid transporter